MKKGFTLVEILAVIVIIGLLGLLITPKIKSIISSNREKSYKEIERRLEEAAGKYITENYIDSSVNEITITKDDLINNNYIDEIYDLKDGSVCSASVFVTNLDKIASFKANLDCSNYKSM